MIVKKGESLRLSFGILLHSLNSEMSIDFEAAFTDYLKLKKRLK